MDNVQWNVHYDPCFGSQVKQVNDLVAVRTDPSQGASSPAYVQEPFQEPEQVLPVLQQLDAPSQQGGSGLRQVPSEVFLAAPVAPNLWTRGCCYIP